MKLKDCIEIGKSCGLETIGECYYNIKLHAISIFNYGEINKELDELQKDIFYHDPDLFCQIFDAEKNELLAKGWKTKEGDDNSMKDKLIDAINYEMEQVGNSDVVIDNIRFFTEDNKQYAMADVSYIWWLDAWDKRVCHKDMIFALVDDDRWVSPIFG